ncbi:patatin-like phospholipase family protein [Enterococcus ureasiticus]|uniref:patatin-like phospholipase family protein n=1 Tax=Enterococcus ureasiticus TaxID=903984 RepID=UPI001F5EA61B|nr:patatin-like phospholipase family protein [Enterococcus ureasiticus]
MVSQIGSFTVNAIQSNGVSTVPKRNLINDTFSQEKMRQVTSDFYLVTTELPSLQEKDIHFNTCQSDRWQSWLLASASFFPAMAATQIDGKYYVDGGYRNNIPIDIALENGATECIVVDVKGPGITKPIKIPATATMLNLQTSWSMGAVLLFDGARSTQNIKLGYLETMKVIGRKYLGHWYTFDETLKNIEKFQQDFFVYIKNVYQINLCDSTEQQNKICQKLRKVYKDRVYTENIGLVLVELLAKSQEISASKLYKIEELVGILQKSGQMKVDLVETIGMISIQEWLKKYYEDYFLLSDKQQLSLMNNLLDADEKEKPQRLAFLLDKLPTQTLQILMKEFILQGVDE